MKSKFGYGISLVLLILLGVAVFTAAGPHQSPAWNNSSITSGSTCKILPASAGTVPVVNFECAVKNDSAEDYAIPTNPRVYIRESDGVLSALPHATVSSDIFIPSHRTVSLEVAVPFSDLCVTVSSSCAQVATSQDALNALNQGLGHLDGLTMLDESQRREIDLALPKHP